MDWMKSKRTTGEVNPSVKLLEEEKFLFQHSIYKFVLEHDIPLDLVLNLDQTPLSYVSPGKYIFDLKGSSTVSIKDVMGERQITATISALGSFWCIQLFYDGKIKRCLLKYDLSNWFDVTFSQNHWFSFEKCISLCIIFYPKEQDSLIVMDTLKGQDSAEIKELCSKSILTW